ncbi:MAG TPA: prolyl oligopeptidase family serine peptidase [Pirellulales bacterium]|nr:prolyl oligopeptidase family serine peptidase [Pirellulales bacterium]
MRKLLLLSIGLFSMPAPLWADAPAQQPARLETQVPVTLNYLLYLPKDYDKKDAWPLVLFLHGAGERGDDLNLVKKHGPPKLIEEGKDLPFIVVSPQCPKDNSWTWQLRELTALVDDLTARYKVDKDRIYLTGLSMGGFGTWALAAYQPDRFAAIIPICGGGEMLMTRRLTQVPIWAFHGAKDPVVPLRRSEELVQALERAKGNVKLTVYPDALHDSWTATYDNPEVWEWLLAQKRAPAKAAP